MNEVSIKVSVTDWRDKPMDKRVRDTLLGRMAERAISAIDLVAEVENVAIRMAVTIKE